MFPQKLSYYPLGDKFILQGTTDNYVIFCSVRGLDMHNQDSRQSFNSFYQERHTKEDLEKEFKNYMR